MIIFHTNYRMIKKYFFKEKYDGYYRKKNPFDRYFRCRNGNQRNKRKIDRLSNKIYQELLGAEAAFLYDQLSLNILKEPQQMSFLDWVIHEAEPKNSDC